jgi:ATP-dependent helicase/nuclease subunit A
LLDLVERLITQLPKNRLIEEGVFLQALIDLTSAFVQKQNADLANFLDWWETDGKSKSVSVPEDQNAIRVMTIHKSKGLEFDVIIMPFLNWDLDDKSHREFMWCEDPFHRLRYIPIKYSPKLLNTSFSDDYLNEHLFRYVDNLNLLYVAFTRAKKMLLGIAPSSNTKAKVDEKPILKTISDLIQQSMNNDLFGSEMRLQTPNWIKEFDDTKFVFGDIAKDNDSDKNNISKTPKSDDFATTSLPIMKTWDYSNRISIFMESTDFITGEAKANINQGKIMHHLFECIKTVDDVQSGVLKLYHEGIISENEIQSIEKEVERLLNHNQVKNWFIPGLKVLNETSILSLKGTYIPDRVILDLDEVIVIDYKFGESMTANHVRQVKNYMNLIREMNYQKVKGYLWYVYEEKIIDVSEPITPTLF